MKKRAELGALLNAKAELERQLAEEQAHLGVVSS